ncbi:hypothetical protein PMM47T1_20718 [Pseudomonas sp. M47T1]|uniref:hypothetical protein n=1 Tax=Pseudomonas sp. M47T1 TaxID=1179778 RepID=UPI00026072F8|nr:hypothetical protein [Pseudomonas sp. M47T1]EIK94555.1 hypothetical protein PMM47T1_20718 [Pseudomonas sp. M47T1]
MSATDKGYISGGKIQESSYAITDLDATEVALAQQITGGLDKKGVLTESLVDSVAQRQGLTEIVGGKYGNNNGFDHVYETSDGKVYLLESKQINGGISLGSTVNNVQMSSDWVSAVLSKLDSSSPAYAAVKNAVDDGTLVKGVIGVDRSTGKLVMVKLK